MTQHCLGIGIGFGFEFEFGHDVEFEAFRFRDLVSPNRNRQCHSRAESIHGHPVWMIEWVRLVLKVYQNDENLFGATDAKASDSPICVLEIFRSRSKARPIMCN